MSIVIALVAGLLGAAIGFAGGLLIATPLATVIPVSSFEGAAGTFAVLIGLIGGATGFLLAAMLTLRYQGGHRGLLAIGGRTAAILIGLAILAAIGIQIRLASIEHFPGANPQMQFEVRLPANAGIAELKGIDFEMQAGSQRSGGLLRDDWLRHDGDQPVIGGLVPLYTRTSQRMLVVSLPDAPRLIFNIKLAATPRASKTFGDWHRVDFLDDRKPDSQPRKPGKSEGYEIRYFVPE